VSADESSQQQQECEGGSRGRPRSRAEAPARASAPPGLRGESNNGSPPIRTSLDVTPEMRKAALAIRPNDSPIAKGLILAPFSYWEQQEARMQGFSRAGADRTPQPRCPQCLRLRTIPQVWRVKWVAWGDYRVEPVVDERPCVCPRLGGYYGWARASETSRHKRHDTNKERDPGAAEAWLRINDPDYAVSSQGWKHVRRGQGEYRAPRLPRDVILSPLGEDGNDAPLDIASTLARADGRKANPESEHRAPIFVPDSARLQIERWPEWAAEIIERVNREARANNRANQARWESVHPLAGLEDRGHAGAATAPRSRLLHRHDITGGEVRGNRTSHPVGSDPPGEVRSSTREAMHPGRRRSSPQRQPGVRPTRHQEEARTHGQPGRYRGRPRRGREDSSRTDTGDLQGP